MEINPKTKEELDSLFELKSFLDEVFKKSNKLHRKIIIEVPKNPIARINEMHVSHPTKENYVREWKLYVNWLEKNKLNIDPETANSYLAQLKCRPSTLKRKHSSLENIFQFVYDNSIKLNKVRMRISFIPKYAMSNEEIAKYLREQSKINHEDYLMQRLMVLYGLRVNTIALLKVHHLEFLDQDFNSSENLKIHLPDSKVKNYRVDVIDEATAKLLINFIGIHYTNDDYVFFKSGSKLSERKRTAMIGKRINLRISESRIFKKNKNYKYTSHMFRKTRAYNMFQHGLKSLKEQVRFSIGQSSGSSAIESYIN